MSSIYIGFIYLWFDTIHKWYYIGSHKGSIDDGYIGSGKVFLKTYKLRPHTFKRKIITLIEKEENILIEEQKWLNLIKPEELLTNCNIKNNTCKYYNLRKVATGGYRKEVFHNLICEVCNIEFIRKRTDVRTCSKSCGYENSKKKQIGKVPWNKGKTKLVFLPVF